MAADTGSSLTMVELRDVAILGAGPAGLASALLLDRLGYRVTLFERFEAPRPLGSGLILQPTGLAVLAELGLDRAIFARWRAGRRVFLEHQNRRYRSLARARACRMEGRGLHDLA